MSPSLGGKRRALRVFAALMLGGWGRAAVYCNARALKKFQAA